MKKSHGAIIGTTNLSPLRRLARPLSLICSLFLSPSCGRQDDLLPQSQTGITLAGDDADQEVVPGSYIVMFRGDNALSKRGFSSFFDEYQYHYLNLNQLIVSDSRIKKMDILTTVDFSAETKDHWSEDFPVPEALNQIWQKASWRSIVQEDTPMGIMTRVDFDQDHSAADVLQKWESQGKIWFAEPNGISRLSQSSDWTEYANSYKTSQTWWHDAVGLNSALNALASGAVKSPSASDIAANPPLIAVLDSGVDYEHKDLKTQIWVNDQPGASGCDNDVYGCNTTSPAPGSFGNGDVWPVGASGPGQAVAGQGKHGTHVAGIVAAKPGNNYGGICPVCKIMVLKVAEIEEGRETPGITDDSQIRALKYVTRFRNNNRNAVRIVNSSFGKYTRSRNVAILIDVLKKLGNGTLVIAAASNEDSMIRSYPAALANAIGVASVNQNKAKSSFSNFGPWVDIAAPGFSIKSTIPADGTESINGTSMAAPVVAGAAGLYLAVNPDASFESLRSRIIDCADPSIYTENSDGARYNYQNYFPQLEGEDSRRPLLGSGMVNVNNMLTSAQCRGAIGKPLDRVTRGCAVIGIKFKGTSATPSIIVVGFFLLPILFLRRRKSSPNISDQTKSSHSCLS